MLPYVNENEGATVGVVRMLVLALPSRVVRRRLRCICKKKNFLRFRILGRRPSRFGSKWFLLPYEDASKSTSHLYLSALSWVSESSPLWCSVRGTFPSEPPTISNVAVMERRKEVREYCWCGDDKCSLLCRSSSVFRWV